jgi:hypothetical protein
MNAEPIVPLCTHIKVNGRTCRSPAVAGETVCYFHNRLHIAHLRPPATMPLTSYSQEDSILSEGGGSEEDPLAVARAYPRQNEIEFPPLEDAESIQLATSMLFQAIATGQIHFKRARLLLYTLKIAVINQRALNQSRAADAQSTDTQSPAVKSTAVKPEVPSLAARPEQHRYQSTPNACTQLIPYRNPRPIYILQGTH